VFGALKGNLLDASKQFQRCYGAEMPTFAGAVMKQSAPFCVGYQAALDGRENVCVEDGYWLQ
jgi:hypothetical protein